MEHRPSLGLPSSLKSYDVTRRRDGELREESHEVSGKPDDDDGFVALAQLEMQQVALGSPSQSLGEDAQAETA